MLVDGVRAVADTAQAIEGGNSQAGGEVAIGAPADGGFAKLPSQVAGDGGGLGIELGDARGALHGRAVDSAGDFELALAVEGAQGAHFFFDAGSVFQAGDADVNLGGGFGGDYVGARAAADNAYIHSQTSLQIGVSGDFFDLAGEFDDGIHALLEIESGVRRFAGDFELIFSDTFAGSFHSSLETVGRFEDEHGSRFPGERFGEGARRVAADFFVGDEEHGYGTRQLAVPVFVSPILERGDGMEHERDSGLHVEDAGASEFVVHYAAGHRRQRAEGIDGVVVAEQEHRLGGGLAGEVGLEMVAEVLSWVNLYDGAEGGKFGGNHVAEGVHGGFVIAGRLDFNQFADGRNDLVAPLSEISEAALGFGSGWCRPSGTLWSFCNLPSAYSLG